MINNTKFKSPSKQKRNTSLLCYKGSYYREGRKNEICSAVGVSDHGSHGHNDLHHSFCTPSHCCPDVIECCGIDGGRKILKP